MYATLIFIECLNLSWKNELVHPLFDPTFIADFHSEFVSTWVSPRFKPLVLAWCIFLHLSYKHYKGLSQSDKIAYSNLNMELLDVQIIKLLQYSVSGSCKFESPIVYSSIFDFSSDQSDLAIRTYSSNIDSDGFMYLALVLSAIYFHPFYTDKTDPCVLAYDSVAKEFFDSFSEIFPLELFLADISYPYLMDSCVSLFSKVFRNKQLLLHVVSVDGMKTMRLIDFCTKRYSLKNILWLVDSFPSDNSLISLYTSLCSDVTSPLVYALFESVIVTHNDSTCNGWQYLYARILNLTQLLSTFTITSAGLKELITCLRFVESCKSKYHENFVSLIINLLKVSVLCKKSTQKLDLVGILFFYIYF